MCIRDSPRTSHTTSSGSSLSTDTSSGSSLSTDTSSGSLLPTVAGLSERVKDLEMDVRGLDVQVAAPTSL
eukprot:1077177-Rhodomonas_salina.1